MKNKILDNAKDIAESMGHDIAVFKKAKKFGKISDEAYSSYCLVCGLHIFVGTNPGDKGKYISGEAITLKCNCGQPNKDMSLSAVLKEVGYYHKPNGFSNGKHLIYDLNDKLVGEMNADECWKWLRETKKISF